MTEYLIPVVIAFASFGIGVLVGWLTIPAMTETATASSAPNADPLLVDARKVVDHVEAQFLGTSGEFKRAQALRMLMNRNPTAKERDCALNIELAVREEP